MIDIRDYDLAMLHRFKTFFDNTFWVQRPNLSLTEIRDSKILEGSDVEFPVLIVRRTSGPIILKENNSWSRYKTGSPYYTEAVTASLNKQNYIKSRDLSIVDPNTNNILKHDSSGNEVFDALDIINSTYELKYFLDIISFERDNFDTLMVEVQENILRNPFITFNNIKSDGSIDPLISGQSCHLDIEEVVDNTDIEDFDSKNAMYRATITLKINAYIYRKCRILSINNITLNEKVFASYDVNPVFDSEGNPITDTFNGGIHYKIYDKKKEF